MKDLNCIKQTIVSCGMFSPYVRELIKKWASRNRVIPHDWLKLLSVILDHGPQLQWKSFWRKETKSL